MENDTIMIDVNVNRFTATFNSQYEMNVTRIR